MATHPDVWGNTDLQAGVDLTARPDRVDLHDPDVRMVVETALAAIPGIIGARIVAGFDREVDEVHVLASLDKSPKHAVRDVQTLLMARFGVTTDHRVISVVRLDEQRVGPTLARTVIERVTFAQAGLEVTAEVVLRDGDSCLTGTAQETVSAAGQLRAVAAATLDAARQLVQGDARIDLEGVETLEVGHVRIGVCLLRVRTRRDEVTLSGSALVRETEVDAVARAVLDGLNRVLSNRTNRDLPRAPVVR